MGKGGQLYKGLPGCLCGQVEWPTCRASGMPLLGVEWPTCRASDMPPMGVPLLGKCRLV